MHQSNLSIKEISLSLFVLEMRNKNPGIPFENLEMSQEIGNNDDHEL